METYIFDHADALRNWALYGTFVGAMLWESLRPGAATVHSLRRRWSNNIGLAILNLLVMRWAIPFAGVGVALAAPLGKWSLLGSLQLPFWLAVLTAILLLDAVKYFEHRVFHSLRPLWRIHLVHHADLDFDVTTGSRHHPFELLAASAIYFPTIVLVGAPAAALVVFEALHAGFASFTHANARFPTAIERTLRSIFVTPEMHRVHHSAAKLETDSNYGTLLSVWDRIFGTYRAAPKTGYAGMVRGIESFRSARDLYLDRMLLLPFLRLRPAAPEFDDRHSSRQSRSTVSASSA